MASITGYIYEILNTVNGWKYIGMTTKTPFERFKQHIKAANSGSNMFIHWAMRTYGCSVFNLSELEKIKTENMDDIYNAEVKHISLSDTFVGDGYNMHYGGRLFIDGVRTKSRHIACLDTANDNKPVKVHEVEYIHGRHLRLSKKGFYIYNGSRYESYEYMPFLISRAALETRCVKNNSQYLTKRYFNRHTAPYTTEDVENYIFNKVRWCDLGWGFEKIEYKPNLAR